MGNRWAIIGSRGFPAGELFRRTVRELITTHDQIISGGAAGPDSWAEDWSKQIECRRLIIPAQWKLYGKAAGHKRNPAIVDESDKVIAFWDGTSRGTRGGLTHAHATGKPWRIVYPDGSVRSSEGF